MRYLAIGGDARMQGAAEAAKKAGWDSLWVRDGALCDVQACDVVMLPWPHSFKEERLIVSPPHEGPDKETLLAALPPARLVVHGTGVTPDELLQAGDTLDPRGDELFLRRNAQLTAEGAILRAMQKTEHALLGSTCLVTGFGRIGQELASRLTAMGAFVIVCARSEIQMRAAHAGGAHPVPLGQLGSAAFAADVIFNTVPARVMDAQVLSVVKRSALIIELASAPYGVELAEAKRLGLHVELESGVPGRYAPLEAGAALFEAAQRHLKRQREGNANG